MEPASVEVRGVTKRFGDSPVLEGVFLRAAPGSTVALLGPSGCGKTTLLRAIAGLERPDAGEVLVGERVLTGPATFVPPEKRRVGMVFQDWALFPHLTVAANVGYGLPRAERRSSRVDEALAMVGLGGMGDRMPGTLSGGQQQRVALARAVAPRPAVVLLDEPFSNLDTTLRVQVRTDVHRLLADLDVTTVFVTHDQEEAFVLGDEVAVMAAGRIVQQASPAELYAHPSSPWVAGFVGDANLLPGRADGRSATTPLGPVALAGEASGAVRVLVRPEAVVVQARASDGAGDGDLDGTDGDGTTRAAVELVEFYGHDTVYLLRLPGGEVLRARVGAGPQHRRGDTVAVRYGGPPTVAYAGG